MYIKVRIVIYCTIAKNHLNKFLALKRYFSIYNK